MVPVTGVAHVDVHAALRSYLVKSCRRELSTAFMAWLLHEPHKEADFASLANRAAAREGAEQDFQTVAVLGFAANAGVLSATRIETLRKGVIRQAGRDAVFDGVPMPFCFDAVGILGIALATKAIADVNITSQVVRWVSKFLRSSYEADRAMKWERCLFAVADRQLGKPLDLAMPRSAATADVRIALLARDLIEDGDGIQAREDAVRTLELAVQEVPKDFSCERAALRLAALEYVTGGPIPANKNEEFVNRAEIDANAKARRTETPPTAIGHGDGLEVGIINAPRINVSGKLLGSNQLGRSNEVAVSHTAVRDQQTESGEMAHGHEERKKTQKLIRRNERYERIDKALRDCAASRPRSHEEVFRFLDDRKVAIPNRKPFKTAGGWFKGFRQNRYVAGAWLSQEWGRLSLPPFPRGPQK
jgi:hypothetical protein